MATAPHANKSALAKIRRELAEQNWTLRDLAKAAGLGYKHVRNVTSGVETSIKARHKIEDALGMAVWSLPEDFVRRQSLPPTPNAPEK